MSAPIRPPNVAAIQCEAIMMSIETVLNAPQNPSGDLVAVQQALNPLLTEARRILGALSEQQAQEAQAGPAQRPRVEPREATHRRPNRSGRGDGIRRRPNQSDGGRNMHREEPGRVQRDVNISIDNWDAQGRRVNHNIANIFPRNFEQSARSAQIQAVHNDVDRAFNDTGAERMNVFMERAFTPGVIAGRNGEREAPTRPNSLQMLLRGTEERAMLGRGREQEENDVATRSRPDTDNAVNEGHDDENGSAPVNAADAVNRAVGEEMKDSDDDWEIRADCN